MSPVPDFDARGFLPPYIDEDGRTPNRAPYLCSIAEFVDRLGTSPRRRELLKGLVKYRAMLYDLEYFEGLQFVDGSFCEAVEQRESREPGDIDVFSFLVRPARYRADPSLWAMQGYPEWKAQVTNWPENKRRYGVDTYAIAVDQANFFGFVTATTYWSSLFSHKRITNDWKGFVQIELDPSADLAATASLGGL